MKKPKDYRLKISEPHTISRTSFKHTFIVRKGDRVSYISADETPLALSNLLLNGAATTRFMLEDAFDGDNAAAALSRIFAEQYKNNKALLPLVTVL